MLNEWIKSNRSAKNLRVSSKRKRASRPWLSKLCTPSNSAKLPLKISSSQALVAKWLILRGGIWRKLLRKMAGFQIGQVKWARLTPAIAVWSWQGGSKKTEQRTSFKTLTLNSSLTLVENFWARRRKRDQLNLTSLKIPLRPRSLSSTLTSTKKHCQKRKSKSRTRPKTKCLSQRKSPKCRKKAFPRFCWLFRTCPKVENGWKRKRKKWRKKSRTQAYRSKNSKTYRSSSVLGTKLKSETAKEKMRSWLQTSEKQQSSSRR